MTPPRRRKAGREHWPRYMTTGGGGRSYYYARVVNGEAKQVSLGSDEVEAIRTALALTAEIDRQLAAAPALGGPRLRDEIPRFTAWRTEHRRLSAKTLQDEAQMLAKVDQAFGELTPNQLDQRAVSAFVWGFKPRMGKRVKSTFGQLLDFCKGHGALAGDNLARNALTRRAERQRRRLELAEFWRIQAAAPPWLARSMVFALHTLLRPCDLVRIRFEDYSDGVLQVRPNKAGAGVEALPLRLQVSAELDAAIRACRDDVASPYIVHRAPARRIARDRMAREHPTQLTEDSLSRAFAEARGRASVGGKNPPSLVEIRALGANQYEAAGWSRAQIQSLMGHRDEATTQIYLSHHAEQWIESPAGLALTQQEAKK